MILLNAASPRLLEYWFLDHGGVVQFWLERRPVTPEVASSSLVVPAIT